MKKSKIKRLVPKKRAQQIAAGNNRGPEGLRELLERAAGSTIAKMRAKGYELITCLESGEGVFVREDDVVGLHVQLPTDLYRRLDDACRAGETSKRNIVVAALDKYLD